MPATETPAPTFEFVSPRALAHVLRAPGELGLGRAYVAGLLEVDDLDAALRIVDTYEPPSLSLAPEARSWGRSATRLRAGLASKAAGRRAAAAR